MAHTTLPGFRDFYPEQFAERAYVTRAWREVARRYAFMEYDGPPLESLELYTAKSGDEIVGQLYNFVDKGGREVALRPEMTPTFARMVSARANSLRKPTRWFSIPQLFRYERQQKGRLREHYQLNVDIVGEAGVAADAELVACAIDICRELRLTSNEVVVRVSDRRVMHAYLAALGIPSSAFEVVLAVTDKLARQPRAVSAEKLAAAGLNEQQVNAVLDITSATLDTVATAIRTTSEPGGEHVEELRRFFEYVGTLVPDGAAWLQFDLSIVRGLAYYTGIVFELFDRSGEFRAICGGGRYDNLLGAIGGAALPALGFGMGDVVLTELLRARKLLPVTEPSVDYWLTADEDVPLTKIMAEAAQLRAQGFSVEYALRHQTPSKQRKSANAAGAHSIIHLTNAAAAGSHAR
ncbi:MAG TPA: histidine--tRNA ligase [Gemmatimonadaceae bacterium]|nr:histidine--tRNA ligase [Gemmatimonadaceae bacterium]